MSDLRGVIVPLITPLNDQYAIDQVAMQRLVDRMVDGGVRGVFVCGTTGEFIALSVTQRCEAVVAATKAAAGRIPVFAGVSSPSLEYVDTCARTAQEAGANYVSLLPPFYFPFSPAELSDYFHRIIDRMPLPVLLYNIPQLMGKAIPLELVLELSSRPEVIGIKDSSGDFEYLAKLIETCRRDDFLVFAGDETRMWEAFKLGADGAVPSIGNVIPDVCVACHSAALAGDWEACRAAQQRVNEGLGDLRGKCTWIEMIAWIKQKLAADNQCEPLMAPIFHLPAATPDHRS